MKPEQFFSMKAAIRYFLVSLWLLAPSWVRGAAMSSYPTTNTVTANDLLPLLSTNAAGHFDNRTVSLQTLANAMGVPNAIKGLPVVTVSANGIANGKASIANAGMMFGPDTPGTATCGLQEAIAALPTAENPSQIGGGTILLGPGAFYIATNLVYSNNVPGTLKLVGAGMNATAIVGTASNAVGVLSVQQAATNCDQIIVFTSDLAFASTTNACMPLVTLNHVTSFDIERTVFTYWPAWTNNGAFGGNNPPGLYGPTFYVWTGATNMNLIGLQTLDVSDYSRLNGNAFFSLCVGFDPSGIDHGEFNGNMWYWIGRSAALNDTNAWPSTNIYHLTGGVVCGKKIKNQQNWLFDHNYWYGDQACYVVGENYYNQWQMSRADQFEAVQYGWLLGPGNTWIAEDVGSGYADNAIISESGSFSVVGAMESGRVAGLSQGYKGIMGADPMTLPGLKLRTCYPTNIQNAPSITITNCKTTVANAVYRNLSPGYWTNDTTHYYIVWDTSGLINNNANMELWDNAATELYGMDPWNGTYPLTDPYNVSFSSYAAVRFAAQGWFPSTWAYDGGITPDWYVNWGTLPDSAGFITLAGAVTNNGVVWLSSPTATNSTAYPSGSIATAGGKFWVLESGTWKQK